MFVNQLQMSNVTIDKSDSSGCQAPIGHDGKCGEVKTLGILREFQQLYENKINEIEEDCKCTSTQTKIRMLQDWIKDLTEQNTLLVQVVEELEHEASERVSLLEEKLRDSSKTSFEIMKSLQEYDVHNISSQTEILQRMMHFQSDINNLTEFIRRVREEGSWNTEGLHFYTVASDDLCGEILSSARNLSKQQDLEECLIKLKSELCFSKQKEEKNELDNKIREALIHEQSEQIEKLKDVVERCSNSMPDRQKLLEELHELRGQLKVKNEDFDRLETSVKDMREALTAEVADKHDSLINLRHECQQLEERCRQADKQTHFKDDIIKEMRKELKQYRSKYGEVDEANNQEDLKKRINSLDEENNVLRNTLESAHEELVVLHNVIDKYNKEHHDIFNTLQNKLNVQITSNDKVTISNSEESMATAKSDISENDFIRTLYLLKTDVNRIIRLSSDNKVNELKKQFSDMENSIHEIESKDKLIKNKDEMIRIQTDTLNVAQRELKELRSKLTELDDEKEKKTQEVRNLQQALDLNQNTIEELEKALRNSDEKANNCKQTADVYVETIQLLENAKQKADTEINQQRITIGNLQDALINVKQQLEGAQNRNAAELKEKTDAIYNLHQNLTEMQSQYMDCYGEIMKITQTVNCLRNSNLDLKVVNINLEKDVDELNISLSKSKDIIQALEEKIKKLSFTNEILEGDINFMKNEMSELSKELKVLQGLLKSGSPSPSEENDSHLSKSLSILQDHSESLVEQLKLTQSQISREIKLNESSSVKILDLEKQLEMKIIEIQRYENEIMEHKSKLNISVRQVKDFESKVYYLEEKISEHEKLQNRNEQNNEEIVLSYNSDLLNLKQKVDILNKILNEKSNEILQLHAELSIKSDTINHILVENKELQDTSSKANHQATNIEKQLEIMKSRCDELTEKYNKCHLELKTIKKLETKSQEDLCKERMNLSDKVELYKKEEARLNSIIKNLSFELDQVKTNLKQKDDNMTVTENEIVSLREEINRATKMRNKVLAENQKLQDQVSKLNISSSQFENRNILITQQLEKCLEELNSFQRVKEKLEERNIQLEGEIDHLQRTFAELNQEIRYKNESVVNLEHELLETKCSRDEICAESRVVVNSVRSWLDEQKRINVVLNNTVKEKNLMIEEISLERNLLLKNIKEVCERYEAMSEELHMCRQYLLETKNEHKPYALSPTWGSQGSIVYDSPSPVYDHGEYDEYATTYGMNVRDSSVSQAKLLRPRTTMVSKDIDHDSNAAVWMRKVQGMNEDLKKSKKYWKNEMTTSGKKIRPVKDGFSMKTT